MSDKNDNKNELSSGFSGLLKAFWPKVSLEEELRTFQSECSQAANSLASCPIPAGKMDASSLPRAFKFSIGRFTLYHDKLEEAHRELAVLIGQGKHVQVELLRDARDKLEREFIRLRYESVKRHCLVATEIYKYICDCWGDFAKWKYQVSVGKGCSSLAEINAMQKIISDLRKNIDYELPLPDALLPGYSNVRFAQQELLVLSRMLIERSAVLAQSEELGGKDRKLSAAPPDGESKGVSVALTPPAHRLSVASSAPQPQARQAESSGLGKAMEERRKHRESILAAPSSQSSSAASPESPAEPPIPVSSQPLPPPVAAPGRSRQGSIVAAAANFGGLSQAAQKHLEKSESKTPNADAMKNLGLNKAPAGQSSSASSPSQSSAGAGASPPSQLSSSGAQQGGK